MGRKTRTAAIAAALAEVSAFRVTSVEPAFDGARFRKTGAYELLRTNVEIARPEGLPAGAIREFTYPAGGEVSSGLGFDATSDLVAFLWGNGPETVEAHSLNVTHALGFGISQAGRHLRDFLDQGFNADVPKAIEQAQALWQ